MNKTPVKNNKILELDDTDNINYTDEGAKCAHCGRDLVPVMENQGYKPPEGPKYEEVVGYYDCEC